MITNVRNFPTYLMLKMGLVKQEPFLLKGSNNVVVSVPKRMMHTAKEVYFTDDYRLDIIGPKLKTQAPNVVDIGANVGYFSAFCFTRFPNSKVVSVEPMPKNIELLKTNRNLNASRNWKIVEGVVSNKAGTVEIQFDDSDSFSTSASLVGLDHGPDLVSVTAQSLPELMSVHNLDQIHILKMDCEGSEYAILDGMSDQDLEKVQFITMETHELDAERNTANMVSRLRFKGWEVTAVRTKVLAENPMFTG